MADDMWMIEAIIQPFKLDEITLALEEIPAFRGMTVSDCRGFGQEKLSASATTSDDTTAAEPGRSRSRDADFIDFTTKLKLEIAVAGRAGADIVVETIARTAHTGLRGDGKIFVWPLARVVRVRTLEWDASAL